MNSNNDMKPLKRKLLYEVEIWVAGKVLTSMTVSAEDDKSAIMEAAKKLKINIRKRYAPKQG